VAVDLAELKRIITKKLKNGSAAGPSGWTGELVAPLAADRECLHALGVLVADIINGTLDDQARSLLLSGLLIPVRKDDGGVRPIAISECFYKLATMYAVNLVSADLPAIFEPIQLGVGAVGGPERAVHIIQSGLETMGADAVLLKCDIKNAFNERKREQILSELFRTETLQPLWRLAHWAYKAPSSMLVFEHGQYRTTIMSCQGVKQGDCLGSLLFSLSVHHLYQRCVRNLKNVRAIAIADDLNLIGSADDVMTAFDNFDRDLAGTGLVLRKEKCGLLWPHATACPERIQRVLLRHRTLSMAGCLSACQSTSDTSIYFNIMSFPHRLRCFSFA